MSETIPCVLDSAISALGYLYNADAVPLILTFLRIIFWTRTVRFAVTFALRQCFSWMTCKSVRGLLKLPTSG